MDGLRLGVLRYTEAPSNSNALPEIKSSPADKRTESPEQKVVGPFA